MKTFFGFFAVGLFAAWTAAAVGIMGPARLFEHPGWFDGGIRLLRDDREIRYYFDHSAWIPEGGVPYSDRHPEEYPPLGVAFFSLPRLFAGGFRAFEVLFVLLTSLCFAVLMAVTASLLRLMGRPPWLALVLLLPASLYFSLWRFDVFPALLVAVSLLAFGRGRTASSLLLMFLAVLAKWYAALFFLPLFICIGSQRIDRKALRTAMAALVAAIVLALGAVTLLSGFGALADPVLYHLGRDFEIGALGTAVILGLQRAGIAGRLPHGIVSWSFLAAQFAAAVPLAMFGRVNGMRGLVRACIFVLLPFMAFGHFFSAQWIVWLAPLAVLVAPPFELALLVALDLVLFVQFPVLFGIDPYSVPFLAVSLVRTALLAGLWTADLMALRASGNLFFRSMKPKNIILQGVDRR